MINPDFVPDGGDVVPDGGDVAPDGGDGSGDDSGSKKSASETFANAMSVRSSVEKTWRDMAESDKKFFTWEMWKEAINSLVKDKSDLEGFVKNGSLWAMVVGCINDRLGLEKALTPVIYVRLVGLMSGSQISRTDLTRKGFGYYLLITLCSGHYSRITPIGRWYYAQNLAADCSNVLSRLLTQNASLDKSVVNGSTLITWIESKVDAQIRNLYGECPHKVAWSGYENGYSLTFWKNLDYLDLTKMDEGFRQKLLRVDIAGDSSGSSSGGVNVSGFEQ